MCRNQLWVIRTIFVPQLGKTKKESSLKSAILSLVPKRTTNRKELKEQMGYKTMNDLMAEYRAHAAAKQWIEAHDTLIFGVQCAHLPAKLELARLYKDCPHLGILQKDRFRKAEYYYRSIVNLLEISDKVTAQISLEMAELYTYMKRPVGVLAMLLKAKRLGAQVPEREVDHARDLLMGLDVNRFGDHPLDAYELGLELYMADGSVRLTELLLREACESDSKLIRGKASLLLADFYNDRRHNNYIYAGEAARYYRQAAEAGFPEYLSRHNCV